MKSISSDTQGPLPARGGWAIPLLIVTVTVALATLLLIQDLQEWSLLEQAIGQESALRMQNCSDALVDYFAAVHSTLLFVSLDNEVMALRQNSRDYIQKVYDHQWERHQLTEIYVIDRDFRGDTKPFMAFEHGTEEESVDEIHSLKREQDEYHAQMEHISRFAGDTNLNALLSHELRLCTADETGVPEVGFVYSVPIRVKDKLVGIVAGMIRKQTVAEILRRGSLHQTALLVSETGDILAGNQAARADLDWFRQQFAVEGVAGFFAKALSRFAVHQQTALWTTAPIPSSRKWWLVYLYNPKEESHATRFSGLFGHFLMATCLILAGSSLAVLVWTLRRQLEEHRWHLQERKRLEWQVQEVSERVQRRIGENLREDLCQRLTGISALSTALGRKLEAAKVPEAPLASEVVQEIKESLNRALNLADELQHVPLQQHGFLAAVKTLATQTEKRSRLACRVEADDFQAELDIAIATQLFRIVQEAIHNAVRHSHATRVIIRLVSNRQQVIASVSDDGTGEAPKLNLNPGLGLRIMRYRSDLIGARLELLPAGNRGILVQCSCPVANHAN